MIRGLVVGVPANDEEATVVDCLASIDRAARALPDVETVIVLAADCCTDATALRAGKIARMTTPLVVIDGRWGTAGGARAAAIDHGRQVLGHVDPATTWIATTDADTVVPRNWLGRQLQHAATGAGAVAGIIELRDDHHRSPVAELSFRSIYRVDDVGSHDHVHGANLGVRADWYDAAGGFPAVGVAEDHLLWNALRRVGARCLSTIDVRVATSARLHSRAAGGFADTLRASIMATSDKAPA
jgi:glycosyltransferase involved in cell wall biosynthesis